MKKISFLLIILFAFQTYGQDSFDDELKEFSNSIANKIFSKKQGATIAILHFTDNKKTRSRLSDYIADDFSVYMVNNKNNIKVLDRFSIDHILNEHQLNSDYYIDPNTAKELGKFIHADYIVLGDVIRIDKIIKISVSVINIETSVRAVSDFIKIPIDKTISYLLGISYNPFIEKDIDIEKEFQKFESKEEDSNILEPYKGKTQELKPLEVINTGKYTYDKRIAGASPDDFYNQVRQPKSSINSSSNKNDNYVKAGSEILKFLNSLKSKEKNIVKNFKVAHVHSSNGVKVNTAYYSQKTNSVFAYIKTSKDISNHEIRVAIINNKGDEVANCIENISQNKREGYLYEFKFKQPFTVSGRMKILFE